MRFPEVHGIIRRRLLVNFRVEPEVIRRLLPAPFRPKLHDGHAIAGICLIRLEEIRPRCAPQILGLSSENAAHRIAVAWEDRGDLREGVYIPRRDTDSLISHLGGGRVFPGEQHWAKFEVIDEGDRIELHMRALDREAQVDVTGHVARQLPPSSVFRTLNEASSFFKPGALGYSVSSDPRRLDGIVLETHSWRVAPLAIEEVYSSYFSDETLFPRGSVELDCALLMRNIAHEWHAAEHMVLSDGCRARTC